MLLVKPSIENVDVTSDPIKAIEAAGRTCWKSEDRIAEGTAEKFVQMVMDRKHDAVLEHGNFILSVSDYLYGCVVDTIEREFLHLTNDVRSGNGCLISGNPRAFRDFCRHPYVDLDLQRAIAKELTDKAPLLFHPMLTDHLDIADAYEAGDIALVHNTDSLSSTERLAHQVLSYRIVCDRGVSHEIVRHRLFSYAQESTRYCNYKGGVTFIIPPWIYLPTGEYDLRWKDKYGTCNNYEPVNSMPPSDDSHALGLHRWFWSIALAERDYIRLLDEGKWTPQQARSVLPNSLKTEIVVTGNLQEWMHFFKLRCSPKAHPQMLEVANMVLADARTRVPVIFDEVG
jgi:thymidylate synthase (FAD)